jgi:hypothetical protein
MRLGGPRCLSGHFGGQNVSCTCRKTNHNSLVTIPTESPRLTTANSAFQQLSFRSCPEEFYSGFETCMSSNASGKAACIKKPKFSFRRPTVSVGINGRYAIQGIQPVLHFEIFLTTGQEQRHNLLSLNFVHPSPGFLTRYQVYEGGFASVFRHGKRRRRKRRRLSVSHAPSPERYVQFCTVAVNGLTASLTRETRWPATVSTR